MRKKGDLRDFQYDMVGDAREAGLGISETVNLLGFSHTSVSEKGPKKRKHPVSRRSEEAEVLPEVRVTDQTAWS